MKGMQKVASLLTGIGTMALLVTPGAAAPAPAALMASVAPTGVDPSMVRAAAAPVVAAPAPVNKGMTSGGGAAEGEKCMVKFFAPEELVHFRRTKKDLDKPTWFFQTKVICTNNVGTSELLIEQNDQLVVAGTITNNQTNVTLHNLTVKLIEEQQETFCLAVARQNTTGSNFTVIAQECFANLDGFGGVKGKNSHGKGDY